LVWHRLSPNELEERVAEQVGVVAVVEAEGIATAARLDPILPAITDAPEALDRLFAALAQVGVTRAAAGALFLRPSILCSLRKRIPGDILASLLMAYEQENQTAMRGADYPIYNQPLERRREVFERVRDAGTAHGIGIDICACKNPDIARGSCNIAGKWPARSRRLGLAASDRPGLDSGVINGDPLGVPAD
jgi:DNA repair photolyase